MSTSNERQNHQQRNEERRFILWSIARANPGRGNRPWHSNEDRDVPSTTSSIFATCWQFFSQITNSLTKQFMVLASLMFSKAKSIDKRLCILLVGLGGLFAYCLLQIVMAEKGYWIEESVIRNLAEDFDFELGIAQGQSRRRANVVAVRSPPPGLIGYLGIRSFDRIVRVEIKRYEDVAESSLISLEKLSHLERMVLGDQGPRRFYIHTNSELKKNWNRVLHIFKTMKKRQNQAMDLRPRSTALGRYDRYYSA